MTHITTKHSLLNKNSNVKTSIPTEKYITWNKSIVSRKLLKLDNVITFKTGLAVNGWIIKPLTSSWSIFIQLYKINFSWPSNDVFRGVTVVQRYAFLAWHLFGGMQLASHPSKNHVFLLVWGWMGKCIWKMLLNHTKKCFGSSSTSHALFTTHLNFRPVPISLSALHRKMEMHFCHALALPMSKLAAFSISDKHITMFLQ